MVRDFLSSEFRSAQSSCRDLICSLRSCQHPLAYMSLQCDTLAIGMMPTEQACMLNFHQTQLSTRVLLCRTEVCFLACAYSCCQCMLLCRISVAAAATSTSV